MILDTLIPPLPRSIKKNGQRHYKKRLYWGAANVDWRLMFPKASIENYVTVGFDHNPIILYTNWNVKYHHYPLRFEWMWTKHPSCID